MPEDRKTDVHVVSEAPKRTERLKLAELSLDRIVADENNARSKLGNLDELAKSIQACGIISPIRVRPIDAGLYKNVFGHRRFAATKVAGFETIPALIGNEDDPQAEINQLVENVQRQDVPAIDLALAISKQPLDDKALAEKMSKSSSWIRAHRALLKLDKQLLKTIKNNGLSLSQAQETKKVMDERGLEAAIDSARAMNSGRLSIREARRQHVSGDSARLQKKTFQKTGGAHRFSLTIESSGELTTENEAQIEELFESLAAAFGRAA